MTDKQAYDTYASLISERCNIIKKLPTLSDQEHRAFIERIKEIDSLLCETETTIPRRTAGLTNYQNEFSIIGMAVNAEITKQIINCSLYTKEEYKKGVRDAFFVGCIIGCTVIAIAFYFAALYHL
jgi:hypothetical protein